MINKDLILEILIIIVIVHLPPPFFPSSYLKLTNYQYKNTKNLYNESILIRIQVEDLELYISEATNYITARYSLRRLHFHPGDFKVSLCIIQISTDLGGGKF